MNNPPWVLGISASHNNGAACLLRGDKVDVAIQEERLTRHKRHSIQGSRPSMAVEYCLHHANIQLEDLSLIVLSCQTHRNSPENNILTNPQLKVAEKNLPFLAVSHHLSHAVSTYVTSGYQEAAILVLDGMGSPWDDLPPEEQALCVASGTKLWETISMYSASGQTIAPVGKDFVQD